MQETLKKVVDYNSHDKNILKVAEECAELGEVMLKYVLKAQQHKPPVDKIVEEAGDVIFRIKVAAEMLGIWDQIEQRQVDKAAQMDEWITKQMYKGGV
jgi:NTP pyrophosphatase (non-canonical NTP hydrolase)